MASEKSAMQTMAPAGDQSIFRPEPDFARYIPGGYSPSRCIKLQGRAITYAIFGFAGCAITFFGYDTAVMSQVNTNEDYLHRMGVASGSDRDAAAIGGLVSLWFGGFAIGALIVGNIADSIGRLKTIQLGCLWGMLGAALLASAQNMTWLAVARVISGIGCGHLNTTVPVWTSEIADHHLRGAFVAVQFTLAMVGSAIFYSMIFTKDKLHTRRRVLLGSGVQVMQKLTGIDFISVYAPNMFALSGFKGDKPALLAGGNWFGYIASLALSIYLADRVGRRKLMLIGCSLMGTVLIVGGVLSHETISHSDGNPSLATQYGSGVAAVLYIYTFIYGSTWLTTCWVYPTEVFPLASRSKGAALSTFAFSIAGGTINMIIPYLIQAISFWVFILFALINLAMLLPIYLFYVETANRHLEQLDILFSSDSCLAWRAEKHFAQMMNEQGGILGEDQEKATVLQVE
ncbi:Low-affinity glucose transporter HXT3 [Penicillium lagena]|uniref:Low-affinity glucose transporter HXT3 n=1 Tax=Penicillium lagena TaxID=94218 RepID=UPI0025415A5B|nr:Low-affinity glucose transporter HXT3 [Penicillium lagena]KAJ5625260.1 Low-affinity glucose transporter HXT3 [Penicillium lagena]